jgi:hypothetical protein
MHVWNIASREEERGAVYLVESLLSAGNLLPQGHDLTREATRQIIEVDEMRTRYDLNMAAADGTNIEKGHQAIVLENDVRPNPTLCHVAKEA